MIQDGVATIQPRRQANYKIQQNERAPNLPQSINQSINQPNLPPMPDNVKSGSLMEQILATSGMTPRAQPATQPYSNGLTDLNQWPGPPGVQSSAQPNAPYPGPRFNQQQPPHLLQPENQYMHPGVRE